MKESSVAILVLAIIFCVGVFFRINAANEPVWLDECHTAWTVDSDSPNVVMSRAAIGNQPPLYFLLVWGVTQVTGLSVLSLRIISIVAGSLLMVVASFWSWKLTHRWTAAVLVAGLIAFDGQFVFYASEARSYALVQLLGLLQAVFFWNLFQRTVGMKPTGSIVSCIALSIAILYCHYTGIWILLSEAFIVLIASLAIRERRKDLVGFATGGLIIGLAMLPLFWNVTMVFERRTNWAAVSSAEQLWNDLEPWLVHWMLIPLGFAFALWLIGFTSPASEKKAKEDSPHWTLMPWIVLWALIGPAGIAVADSLQIAPVALVRYSAICWVAFALFAGLCLSKCSRNYAWIAGMVILGSSFFGNWWLYDSAHAKSLLPFRSEDWVEVVRQLDESDSDQPVFQFADVIEDIDALEIQDESFQEYLLFPMLGADAIRGDASNLLRDQKVQAMPTWNVQFTNEQLKEIRDAKGCWLIVRGDQEYAEIVPCELEDYLGEKIEFKFIPNERMGWSRVHLIRVRTVAVFD